MITFNLKDSGKVRILVAVSGNDLKSFSKKADISYSYFINILSGKYTPSAIVANKIASTLGKDVKDLFDIVAKEKVT